MTKVDARGYSCPEPVIMAQNAVKEGTSVEILVDNMTPVKNISRFAANNNLTMEYVETPEGDYLITLK
ncbi:sulfurtransferase TusA family protein [Mogibacterium timidum]